jgi:hypothetical protein
MVLVHGWGLRTDQAEPGGDAPHALLIPAWLHLMCDTLRLLWPVDYGRIPLIPEDTGRTVRGNRVK